VSDDYSSSDYDYVTRGEARQEARREFAQALADAAKVSGEATAGRQRAIEEVSKEIPGFKEFVNSPQQMATLQTVLKENPVLGDAIAWAETTPSLQDRLPGLYKITFRLGQAQQTQQPSHSQTEQFGARPESPRPSGFTEESIYSATEASKRVTLSPENRKRLISDLEERGVLDVEF
jgi:hypothetical protein